MFKRLHPTNRAASSRAAASIAGAQANTSAKPTDVKPATENVTTTENVTAIRRGSEERYEVEHLEAEWPHADDAPFDTPARGGAGEGWVRARRQRQRSETRAQLLERLTNPPLSLHETGILLGVCAATVRRYCDEGRLPHVRTEGGQRRFRLHEVLNLMREMETRRKEKERVRAPRKTRRAPSRK